jgi:glutathionylspermidine synthase
VVGVNILLIKNNKVRKNFNDWCLNLDFPYAVCEKNILYWDESHYYIFDKNEFEYIKNSTNELVQMVYQTCSYIINNNLLSELHIPVEFHEAIKYSFFSSKKQLRGRFDFAFNNGKIKLLEYNSDTPLGILETGKIIPAWEEEVFSSSNPFNSIQNDLKEFFLQYIHQDFYFAVTRTNQEDLYNTFFLFNIAKDIGVNAHIIEYSDLRYDENNLYDKDFNIIKNLYKLEPWEHIFDYDYDFFNALTNLILNDKIFIYEEIWNIIPSNKSFLIYIKKLFPESEFLLDASFDFEDITSDLIVKKPVFEREGKGIEILNKNKINIIFNEISSINSNLTIFNEDLYIYQEYFELSKNNFNNKNIVIGSWVINHSFSGILIREDLKKVTDSDCQFIPYILKEN